MNNTHIETPANIQPNGQLANSTRQTLAACCRYSSAFKSNGFELTRIPGQHQHIITSCLAFPNSIYSPFTHPSIRSHAQINLTVRDKPPTTPAVQYPPSPTPSQQSHQHHRHQRLAAATTTRRRPVSASHPSGLNDDAPSFGGGSNRFSAARLSAQLSTSATSFVNDPPHRRRPRTRPVSADVSALPPRFAVGTRAQSPSLRTTADGLATLLHKVST